MLASAPAEAQLPAPKEFDPPAPTEWKPLGCRLAGPDDPLLPSRRQWTNLHGDAASSDELTGALGPMWAPAWTAEAATYNPTGPVFDRTGNLYFSPFVPYENVILISLDPSDGSRRWAIPGTGVPSTASAPMVLADPDAPGEEIVYQAVYNRAVAVRTDGSVVWDVPTGLGAPIDALGSSVLGINYVPPFDAVAGLTSSAHLFLLDRSSGAQLGAPFQLPGAPSPSNPSTLPPAFLAAADAIFRQWVNVPPGSFGPFIQALLGNGIKVANMFAVDARTGRLWVAATAPDGEDGSVDGVSELGALYQLAVAAGTAGAQIQEICHRSFAGGSASTPTVSADGQRVYLGDNVGALIAVGTACEELWSVDVGAQIFGSIAVASDNGELYASTQQGIVKVIDQGASGQIVWTADLDVFDLAPGQQNLNLNLVAIGANGLAFQAAAGIVVNGTPLPSLVGVGVLDRDSGSVRSFTGGGEETVAVMSAGPDGALYLGNSPLRRIFAQLLSLSPAPLTGGVTKFAAPRADLLMRDAVCAADARVRNAALQEACPASVAADIGQVRELIAQTRAAAPAAVDAGQIRPTRWSRLDRRLGRAEVFLDAAVADPDGRGLERAGRRLKRVCRQLSRQ
jgi:outer membrane protein assembly factor BamB